MKKYVIAALFLAVGLFVPGAAHAAHRVKANETKHTIKAGARPFKVLGKHVKGVAKDISLAGVQGFLATIAAFDTAVIDPLGVGLQGLADGLDMFVAAPLESLPEPFEAIGDGVHYVYLGIDKAGQVLAR